MVDSFEKESYCSCPIIFVLFRLIGKRCLQLYFEKSFDHLDVLLSLASVSYWMGQEVTFLS